MYYYYSNGLRLFYVVTGDNLTFCCFALDGSIQFGLRTTGCKAYVLILILCLVGMLTIKKGIPYATPIVRNRYNATAMADTAIVTERARCGPILDEDILGTLDGYVV